MPEIALNGLLLDSPYSGTATYTRGLVPALTRVAPDLSFRLFVRRGSVDGMEVPTVRIPSMLDRKFLRAAGGRADKLLWESILWPVAAARHGDALLHSLYFAAPPFKSRPTVVTIHDVIPLAVPGYHRSRSSALYARLMGRNVRQANAIITVSEHARQDILRTLDVPPERVFVTPEAADERFTPDHDLGELERIRSRYGLPDRFVLYLGGAERRKNLETLVRAWQPVAAHMRMWDVGLVIVANFPPPDALYPDTRGLVRALGVEDSVTFVPEVAEEDKPAVYRAAEVFCFPSVYEGFGLTPLEAMACGTPVISSCSTSLPEVVGDAGISLDPHDIPAWTDAIRAVVDSPRLREDLGRAGIERASHFSWDRTAMQTADVYRWVMT